MPTLWGASESAVCRGIVEEPELVVLDGDVIPAGAAAVAGEAPECFSFWSYVRTLAREIHGNTLKAVIVCVCLPEQVLPRPDEPPLRASVLALVVDREARRPPASGLRRCAQARVHRHCAQSGCAPAVAPVRDPRDHRLPCCLVNRDSTFSGAWLVAIAGRMPAATEGLISSPRDAAPGVSGGFSSVLPVTMSRLGTSWSFHAEDSAAASVAGAPDAAVGMSSEVSGAELGDGGTGAAVALLGAQLDLLGSMRDSVSSSSRLQRWPRPRRRCCCC